MIHVLRIAHLRIAPQEGKLEVGNCEGNLIIMIKICVWANISVCMFMGWINREGNKLTS